jgi:oligopeptide transport system substrate-binding protein
MLRVCLVVLCSLLAVLPHMSRASEARRAAEAGILLYVNGAEPQSLDIHIVTGMPEGKILGALLEGLVSEHPTSDVEVEPGVAERWELSEDGRTWTFHLRPNARWSNGDPVTAADFLTAFHRILNPALGAPYANMLFAVENAEAFSKGVITSFDEVGFHAPDPHTLVIRLRAPVPHFLQLLKHWTWFPVHRPTLERFDAFARRGTPWTQAANFVGNGPFLLESWRVNQVLSVRRSPTYWDVSNVRLNGIDFLPIQNRETANTAFDAGQVHVTDNVPLAARRNLIERRDPTLRKDRQFATGYLLFNTARPGIDNTRVRQALSLAINRDAITDDLLLAGEPAFSFTPPGIAGYEPPELVEYNPARARTELAAAGFPGGRGFPRLFMSITTSDTTRILSEALQAMWRSELGIEVELRSMEWRVLLDTLDSRNYDLSFLMWYGDYVDPHTFLEVMGSRSGNNRSNWASQDFDALLSASLLDPVQESRFRRLQEAETILLNALPITPIYHVTHVFRVSPLVEGFGPKLLDQRPWKYISLRSR